MIIDVKNPERINRKPNKITRILTSNSITEQGFLIKKIDLKWYKEKFDENHGVYSLITVFLETDRGSIETTYDEGYLGENPLDRLTKFLTSHLGISGLIMRSLITLKNELKQNT